MHIDEIELLNQEIAAMVRAGIPLDAGMRLLARDLPRKMRPIAHRLGESLSRGVPLDQALDEYQGHLPLTYKTIVLAGYRCGNLAAGLEAVSTSLRRIADLRQQMGIACIYPLLLFVIASILFFAFGEMLTDVYHDTFEVHRITPSPAATISIFIVDHFRPWVLPTMLVTVMLMGAIWWQTGRVATETRDWHEAILGWIPGVGGLLRSNQHATLVTLLRALLAQRVELAEALCLATAATGSRWLMANGQALADELRQGQPIRSHSPSQRGIHPLVTWLLCSCSNTNQLVESLDRLAEHFEYDVRRRAQSLSVIIPALITVVIAGGITLAYVTVSLLPWTDIMQQIGQDA